jgi:uncharacterized protein
LRASSAAPSFIVQGSIPHAIHNVSGFPAGLRDRPQRPHRGAGQSRGLCGGEENRAVGRQVQVTSDQAKNGSARLAGVEPPKFEDNETTIDQLKERLAKTVAYLKTLDAKAIDASSDREITFPLGPTNKGHMKGADYLNHFVLPNFYFHLSAAYANVRACGVDVGKRDFLGVTPMKRT